MSQLFDKIQAILKARHISQAEFSRRIQVTPQRYSKWVHGTGEPGPISLLRIARALNVTMESLVDDQLPPTSPTGVELIDPFRKPRENEGQGDQRVQNPQEARAWPVYNKSAISEAPLPKGPTL